MYWTRVFVSVVLAALAGWGVDLVVGPFGTRIVDREVKGNQVRIVATATVFPDTSALLDFLDTLKDMNAKVQVLQVDIVKGRQGATLSAMDHDPQKWAERVLVSYRRTGDSETTIVSGNVPGALSR